MGDVTLKYLLFGEDRTASKTVKGVGDAAESTAGRLGGIMSRLSQVVGGDMGELINRAGGALDEVGKKQDTLAKKLGVAGSVALGAGVAMQQMASGDVEAHNALVTAVENSGKSYDDFAEQVDGAIASSTKFGHTDGDVQAALAKLTDATHDPAKALNDLALVQDLAAAKGISLGEAAVLVGKAHNGSAKVFKEFGVEVKKTADGTADYDGALGDLAETLHGRAAASADSFGGKVREMRADLSNAASGFAEEYGPAVTVAGGLLTGLAAVLEIAKVAQLQHTASTIAAKAAQIAGAAATGVATAAQWLWNAALTANPIGLIVIAIAAFVGAILWLWNNVDWFRNGVTKAWEAIKTGWQWMYDNVIKPGIDAFGAAFRWLWNNVLMPVTRLILNGFANLTDGLATFLDMLGNIPGFEWAKSAADKMHSAADKARDLAAGLNAIPDNTNVTVSTRFDASYTQAFATAMNSLNNTRKLAAVGNNAAGTASWRGGLTWVGEQGPELVSLPAGTRIWSNAESVAMAPNTRPTAQAAAVQAPTLVGVRMVGTLDTPWGPAQVDARIAETFDAHMRSALAGVN